MKKENKISEKELFKKHLEKIEDPNYDKETNFALPENPTPLQVAKYKLCKQILGYKLKNSLTREQVAEKIGISKAEIEDILFCHIEEFTLDRLITWASKFFSSPEIEIVVREKEKINYARVH